ncbi:glycosyl hydrolase [Paenibacillus sp. MMS20-IR301]|uniref:glycosyl hydrolase n=1 Tax=Paenibacillus sp. MMS20-IR301 TaxID=2895946 RepID=UPI0028E38C18|nr:glycosyl hydrolase [Paenibacillus sp. MMS20-IR301]WNS44035.1 glycosyl hydrolase [Paenibacillus sp. MMS20-IR301]
MNEPLYRDPVYDGATDPAVIYNRQAGEWWMIYTSRRATAEGPGVAWVHGSDLGVAASGDGGATWTYRGVLTGLEIEWGRNTFWAPEIIWHDGLYHMYVSYIQGVPVVWAGHKRHLLHYTSPDLLNWSYQSRVQLSTEYVIDACVHQLPDGRFRMWYKDEESGSYTYAADSEDLYTWKNARPVLTHQAHEGPNVFRFKQYYWMIIDEWRGQAVYRSEDLEHWERNGLILGESGSRTDDQGYGFHADVVVQNGQAYIFYFTHPGRYSGSEILSTHENQRSSIQAARLGVADGVLICDRNESFELKLLPEE